MTAIPFQFPNRAARRAPLESRHGPVRRFAESAVTALREWRRRVRNRNELMALDDRTLHDLGLCRGDIPYLVSKARERRSSAEGLLFPPF
jgi:uncharacterized protein YjiS (DUF1127 family)